MRPLLTCLAAAFCLACGSSLPTPGEHASTTPVPRDADWWTNRHGWIAQHFTSVDPQLLFLGDSITQGWESDGAEVWTQFYGERNPVNLGFSGDRTQHLLWRIEQLDWEDLEPKLAVVLIGTNNSLDDTPEAIFDGVVAVLRALEERIPDTPLLLLGLFPRGEGDDDPRRQHRAPPACSRRSSSSSSRSTRNRYRCRRARAASQS